jgi:hypothetical protein
MNGSGVNLRRLALRISPDEATFARRGFRPGDFDVQLRLERVGREFISGYMAALEERDTETLGERLNRVNTEHRGFAFEGAAMALSLQDALFPRSQTRFRSFLTGPGKSHTYMLHVGAGWAAARLPWLRFRINSFIQRFDPLLKWLVVDGFGFHEGYFQPRRRIDSHDAPFGLSGYASRAFDQGLGRSLWFVCCADVAYIADTIAKFPPHRRRDLWSGAGLACAYAGGVDDQTIITLMRSAGRYYPELAQGAAFAAKARQRAGNPADHTARVCQIVCEMNCATAAAITDEAVEGLPSESSEPAYEIWRQRVQNQFSKSRVSNAK